MKKNITGVAFIPDNKLDIVRNNGAILNKIEHEARDLILKEYKNGVTELDVDDFVGRRIKEEHAIPSCKGYKGYKHATCISTNDTLVHGVPSKRKFRDGDLVTIDCAINKEGYHVDKALPFIVGDIKSHDAYAIMMASVTSLNESIKKAIPGNKVGDIAFTTFDVVSSFGFYVTEKFVGHGVGTELHMLPAVPNYGTQGQGQELYPGMCIAIEPMVLMASNDVFITDDGWTVKSFDECVCCHCEDTVYISEEGPIVITRI